MKTLVVGVDGLGCEQFTADRFPRLTSILHSLGNTSLPAYEDLSVRGWAKMLVGRSAVDVEAFYVRPEYPRPAFSFSNSAYESVRPLWQAVNEAGLSVGLLSVPTTYPAVAVEDGYCVAGLGAGVFSASGLDTEMIFRGPARLLDRIDVSRGFEQRFSSFRGKLSDFIAIQVETASRRAELCRRLQQHRPVDFLIVVFKELVNCLNLAMDTIASRRPNGWSMSSLCDAFDSIFADLIDSLEPDDVVLGSDHGTTRLRGFINIPLALRDAGILVSAPHCHSTWRRPKGLVRIGLLALHQRGFPADLRRHAWQREDGTVLAANHQTVFRSADFDLDRIDTLRRSGTRIHGVDALYHFGDYVHVLPQQGLFPSVDIARPIILRPTRAFPIVQFNQSSMVEGMKSTDSILSVPSRWAGQASGQTDLSFVYDMLGNIHR